MKWKLKTDATVAVKTGHLPVTKELGWNDWDGSSIQAKDAVISHSCQSQGQTSDLLHQIQRKANCWSDFLNSEVIVSLELVKQAALACFMSPFQPTPPPSPKSIKHRAGSPAYQSSCTRWRHVHELLVVNHHIVWSLWQPLLGKVVKWPEANWQQQLLASEG